MPTKKKRVGFIPREDVMKIIDNLSIENNLSNSKIISILVEEALSVRGIFNKKIGRVTQLYQNKNYDSKDLSEDLAECKDNDKFNINTNLENHKNLGEINFLEQDNKENFDFQTYKTFLSFLKFQEMMDKYNS